MNNESLREARRVTNNGAWFRRFERQLARAKARKEAEARARACRGLRQALKALLDKQEAP